MVIWRSARRDDHGELHCDSDDIKAGHVLNAATAAGDPIEDPKNPDEPKKPEGEDEEDDETDDLDTTLTVTKSSDVAEGATVGLGETIHYTITVKNDGNVPYTGVVVEDYLTNLVIDESARYTVNGDGTVTIGNLAVGETVTITASYEVTSDDIEAGHVLNTATAAGDPIDDPKNPEEPQKPECEDEEDDKAGHYRYHADGSEDLQCAGRRDGRPGRHDYLYVHGDQ